MSTPVDQQALSQAIELLNQAKPLFESGAPIALAAVGILGTIGGVLASFFPGYWLAKRNEQQLKNSVATQLYAEIQAIQRIEQHRGYISTLREIIAQFDRGEVSSASYVVQVANDRFPIYRANIQHLGMLEPKLQQKIVLVYQLIEAGLQDIQPGGLLNATQVGREPFAELHEIFSSARCIGDEVLAQIEAEYLNVR
jgi:hypothetical protein